MNKLDYILSTMNISRAEFQRRLHGEGYEYSLPTISKYCNNPHMRLRKQDIEAFAKVLEVKTEEITPELKIVK